MTMSVGGETAPERKKGGNNTCWAYTNFTGLDKIKKFTRLIQLLQMDGKDLKEL
jgi:hypothetical protein